MLLDHFDNNQNFLAKRNRFTFEFLKKGISLMLDTEQGKLPVDNHMLGSWRLSAEHALTVRMWFKHGLYRRNLRSALFRMYDITGDQKGSHFQQANPLSVHSPVDREREPRTCCTEGDIRWCKRLKVVSD